MWQMRWHNAMWALLSPVRSVPSSLFHLENRSMFTVVMRSRTHTTYRLQTIVPQLRPSSMLNEMRNKSMGNRNRDCLANSCVTSVNSDNVVTSLKLAIGYFMCQTIVFVVNLSNSHFQLYSWIFYLKSFICKTNSNLMKISMSINFVVSLVLHTVWSAFKNN